MKTFKDYLKEMGAGAVGGGAGPTNVAGGGNVASLGVGPQGEPGVHMKKKRKNSPIMMSVRRK